MYTHMYTWGTRLYSLSKLAQQIFIRQDWTNLPGQNSCLNPLGSTHFWPGQLVQSCRAKRCWTSFVQKAVDLASVYKLAGSTCLNQLGSFPPRNHASLPGQLWFEPTWFRMVQNKVFDPTSLHKLARSKVCWTKGIQTTIWPGRLVQSCRINICWTKLVKLYRRVPHVYIWVYMYYMYMSYIDTYVLFLDMYMRIQI